MQRHGRRGEVRAVRRRPQLQPDQPVLPGDELWRQPGRAGLLDHHRRLHPRRHHRHRRRPGLLWACGAKYLYSKIRRTT